MAIKTICANCSATYVVAHDLDEDDYIEQYCPFCGEEKEIEVTTQPKLPFWDAPENKQPYFMQVVGPLKKENWKKLKTISYAWHESQPESIEAHSNYALALFKLGDTAKSEEEFKKIAEKNPNFVQSFLYLYEIAKLRENKQDIAKYKSIVFSLDETIVIE